MRDIESLTRKRYDLVVVGGGIHGLFAAYDAAGRGLSVALVERSDFGGGLSFNHQRTIHGGLRDLERGRFFASHRNILERRTWARIAPHLLRPLPFLIGTYRWTKRSRWAVKLGFAAYEAIGRRHNVDITAELHLPRARLESAAATRRLFPGIRESGLTGGAIWYDYQVRHPDRLNWLVAVAAAEAGAALANYTEVVGALKSSGRATGVRVRDAITGREHDLEAEVTLLAPGSRLAELQALFGVTGAPRLLRAMNVLLNRPARDIALGAPTPTGRMLTAVPWSGFLLVGTSQSEGTVDPSAERLGREALDLVLGEANATFEGLDAKVDEVRLVHHGLVPARSANGRAELLTEPLIMRHAGQGVGKLVSLAGVKLTGARWAAERAIDAVVGELGRPAPRGRTGATTLPHAGIADVEGRLVEALRRLSLALDRDVVEHLVAWYGTEAPDVVQFSAHAELVDRLAPRSPVIAGEVAYAVERARAVRLADVVLRRTALGSAGHPGPEPLARAAVVMGARLGWSPRERTTQVLAVEQTYELPQGK